MPAHLYKKEMKIKPEVNDITISIEDKWEQAGKKGGMGPGQKGWKGRTLLSITFCVIPSSQKHDNYFI